MTTWCAAPWVAFGSCQERLMFPTHFARDRMGNEMLELYGSKELGPGCYDNHTVGSLIYELQHRPESKRGYVLGARTAPRFLPPIKKATPSPQKYQQDWTRSKVCPPGKAPFNSATVKYRLRTWLIHDKEFRKQRNRVAYLSLFY
ncbi:Protein pitchfork [Labeo rohita]|uniref:Protein pitchfork n=1 Tax=Labeo rohita TaxID=84645 RepID=A0ABQ8LFX1_LABRO|nr:Protein pitchfork [Labeo rohita]